MFRSHQLLIMLVVSVAALAMPALARNRETGFLNRSLSIGGVAYKYQVYVPPTWNKSKKWPVVLFLHGAGERGDDGLLQTEVGIGTAIRRHSERFPCVIVFPQCRKDVWWTDADMEAQALKALDQSIAEFNGAANRVYLTGISMGGYGTWRLASLYPGKFAAYVPVCGGIVPPPGLKVPKPASTGDSAADPYTEAARKVGMTPVWVFHGSADPAVPVSESRKMVEALKAAGSSVKYTEYEGVGHNSWDRAYADPDLMPWMLAQESNPKVQSKSKK
jgi:predicted peptidase